VGKKKKKRKRNHASFAKSLYGIGEPKEGSSSRSSKKIRGKISRRRELFAGEKKLKGGMGGREQGKKPSNGGKKEQKGGFSIL